MTPLYAFACLCMPLHAFATSAYLQFGAIVRRFSDSAFLIGHDGEKLHGLCDTTALNGSEFAAAAVRRCCASDGDSEILFMHSSCSSHWTKFPLPFNYTKGSTASEEIQGRGQIKTNQTCARDVLCFLQESSRLHESARAVTTKHENIMNKPGIGSSMELGIQRTNHGDIAQQI